MEVDPKIILKLQILNDKNYILAASNQRSLDRAWNFNVLSNTMDQLITVQVTGSI